MKRQNLYYIVACVILILANLYIREYSKEILIPPSQAIKGFPVELKGFIGKEAFPSYKNFHDPAADEWILRIYTKKGEYFPIRLFLGYWKSQNEEKRIAPPRNTDNRWEYYWIKDRSFLLGSKTVNLKEFLNERDNEKELVYYCYIIDGKIISNEYYLRFLNMFNSLLYNRSNTALLRISAPVTDKWSVKKVEAYEEDFIKKILPLLLEYV